MFEDKFKEALSFLDDIYYMYKRTETGFNYLGLVFDSLFENCVFCIDYLNINDFFKTISGLNYTDDKRLIEQYSSLTDEEYSKLFGAILSLLHQQKDRQSEEAKKRIINFFARNNIYNDLKGDYFSIYFEKIIGSGSYADVILISNTILKKRLNKAYIHDLKQQKRIKYEFENMKKLSHVDSVLNVYEFDENEHSYLMEKCDGCLYDYLIGKILSNDLANDLILQTLNALKDIHDMNIIHRDLHLGNLLVKNGRIVISDFGLSKDLNIKRSLTSSDTPKNNNSFVDPIGLNDFTKLDKQSDLYSAGKIIEFIVSNNSKLSSLYSSVIDKCTERRRDLRYQSVDEILEDVQYILNDEVQTKNYLQIIKDISLGQFDIRIKNLIIDFTNRNEIASFIVENRLYDFGKVLLNFDFVDQENIAKSISENYVNATGYGGWNNYDIFTSIAMYIIENSSNVIIRSCFYKILKEIAEHYRWGAKNKLEYIDKKYPNLFEC